MPEGFPTSDELLRTLNQLKMPALAGGAGALASGYAASRGNAENETPQERRRRIIRQALVGGGLGSVAGAALPASGRMISDAWQGDDPDTGASGAVSSLVNWTRDTMGDVGRTAINNPILGPGATVGAVAGGYPLFLKNRGARKDLVEKALVQSLRNVKGLDSGPIQNIQGVDRAINVLGGDAGKREGVKRLIRQAIRDTGGRGSTMEAFRLNDLLRGSGRTSLSFGDIGKALGSDSGAIGPGAVRGAYGRYLRESPGLDKLIGMFDQPSTGVSNWLRGGGAGGAGRVIGNKMPTLGSLYNMIGGKPGARVAAKGILSTNPLLRLGGVLGSAALGKGIEDMATGGGNG